MIATVCYILAMLFVFASTAVAFYCFRNDRGLRIKHVILGSVCMFVLGIIPIINVLVSAIIVVMIIFVIVTDDHSEVWWNKSVRDIKKK